MSSLRGSLWVIFLVQFGYLWAQLPNAWWRLPLIVVLAVTALTWFEREWADRG